MPTNQVRLTRKQFDEGGLVFPANHVVVEVSYSNENAKTKAGIVVGFDKDKVFAEGNEVHAADLMEVYGTVAKVPEKLYFNPEDPKSPDYETEMELEVNNIVWFSILESANALEILVEDKLYKVMPYSDIYCVKRGDEVIVLNGLCLCQTVTHKKISELDFISESRIDMSKCVVKFIGKPNKRYKNENYVDHQDLKVDDLVLLQPRTPIPFLERKAYMAKFNGDELYIIVPRRKIVAVLNRQE
jgi:hypothetical protein